MTWDLLLSYGLFYGFLVAFMVAVVILLWRIGNKRR